MCAVAGAYRKAPATAATSTPIRRYSYFEIYIPMYHTHSAAPRHHRAELRRRSGGWAGRRRNGRVEGEDWRGFEVQEETNRRPNRRAAVECFGGHPTTDGLRW